MRFEVGRISWGFLLKQFFPKCPVSLHLFLISTCHAIPFQKPPTAPHCLQKYVHKSAQPSCWSTRSQQTPHCSQCSSAPSTFTGLSCCFLSLEHLSLCPQNKFTLSLLFMAQILFSSQKLIFFPPYKNNPKFFIIDSKVLKCPWLPFQPHFLEIQFHQPRVLSHFRTSHFYFFV